MTTTASSIDRMTSLVESIQHLNSTEYEELFKLLHQNNCKYTRNNNGIFLNLSWLSDAMIEKIELFVDFCKASRREIQHYETICKNLSNQIQTKEDPVPPSHPIREAEPNGVVPSLKASTAMKFYLLKKKYSKMSSFESTPLQNDLGKEAFILP